MASADDRAGAGRDYPVVSVSFGQATRKTRALVVVADEGEVIPEGFVITHLAIDQDHMMLCGTRITAAKNGGAVPLINQDGRLNTRTGTTENIEKWLEEVWSILATALGCSSTAARERVLGLWGVNFTAARDICLQFQQHVNNQVCPSPPPPHGNLTSVPSVGPSCTLPLCHLC